MDVPHLPHLLLRPLNVISTVALPAGHTLGPVPTKRALPKQAASFIETMDCLPVAKLPDGPQWTYEIKLDGYRLEVVRTSRATTLYSRRANVLNQRFPYIATALKHLPNDTVIDGELVAL